VGGSTALKAMTARPLKESLPQLWGAFFLLQEPIKYRVYLYLRVKPANRGLRFFFCLAAYFPTPMPPTPGGGNQFFGQFSRLRRLN